MIDHRMWFTPVMSHLESRFPGMLDKYNWQDAFAKMPTVHHRVLDSSMRQPSG